METVIGSAAAECASTSLASFREDCERITKYWDRVKDVRSKREKMEAMIGQTGDTNALGKAKHSSMWQILPLFWMAPVQSAHMLWMFACKHGLSRREGVA